MRKMRTVDINQLLRAMPREGMHRGAPMGATNYDDRGPEFFGLGMYARNFYCQRVRFVDGDYGPDGTYWGNSPSTGSVWCVFALRQGFDRLTTPAHQSDAFALRWYVRAKDRAEALRKFREENTDRAGPLHDRDYLDAIAATMDGKEWNAATLEEVAQILRNSGRTINEPEK